MAIPRLEPSQSSATGDTPCDSKLVKVGKELNEYLTVTLYQLVSTDLWDLEKNTVLTNVVEDPSLWIMQYPPQHRLQYSWVWSMHESHWEKTISKNASMNNPAKPTHVLSAFPTASRNFGLQQC